LFLAVAAVEVPLQPDRIFSPPGWEMLTGRSQGPGGPFFKLFVPHTVPHGRFLDVLSASRSKQKPRICGVFVE
jgi:hypothetical protein